MWWSAAYAAMAVGDFTAVEIDTPCSLELVAGDRSSIELVEGSAPTIEVVAGVLEVRGGEDGCVLRGTHVGLTRLAVAGEAAVHVDTLAPRATVLALGGARIAVDMLASDRLDAQLAGTSRLTVHEGSVGSLRLRVTGGSVVDVTGLKAVRVDVSASTRGEAAVRATHRLDVHAVGGSSVRWVGSPTQRQVRQDRTSAVQGP